MRKSITLNHVADIVLVLVALTMLALFLVSGRQRPIAGTGATPAAIVPAQWQAETLTGISMGSADADLKIVEFMDFQCPFCAAWAARVDSLLRLQPNKVHVVLHHYPLSSHPHALKAAVAAECADRQRRFELFQRAVFTQQSLIGHKAWREFAIESGVQNLAEFEHCIDLPADSFPRIAYGQDLAKRTRATGTPTVWVNGKVSRPSLQELIDLVH